MRDRANKSLGSGAHIPSALGFSGVAGTDYERLMGLIQCCSDWSVGMKTGGSFGAYECRSASVGP
jgi:hypothetical protein